MDSSSRATITRRWRGQARPEFTLSSYSCALHSFSPHLPSSLLSPALRSGRRSRRRPPRLGLRRSSSARCAGATSARRAPDAPARPPASPASRTRSTPASTTAASGDPPTTAPTGCRCSTTSPPDRSARSRSRRRIPTSSTSGPARASSAPISRSATASTSPPTPGRTWQHLGLRDSQMIAAIAVDPANADRFFVAVLGHPVRSQSPSAACFAPPTAARTFEKVLYKDEYTSANEVLIDPRNPNIALRDVVVAATELHRGPGIRRRRHGHLQVHRRRDDLDAALRRTAAILQANIAIAPSDPNILYATIAPGQGQIGFYKSTDGGAHWFQAISGPGAPAGLAQDMRPLARIGGGDLPTVTVDPKDPNVVYTASTVMWRTLDGGLTWSAVRGAPGGDDYQRIWINPNDPQHHPRRRRSGRGRLGESRPELEQLVQPEHRRDVSRHHRQRVSVSRLLGPAGLRQRLRAEPIGRRADHVSRLASGEHPGIRDGRAGSEESGHRLRQPAQRRVPLRSADGADDAGRARHVGHASRRRRDEPQCADDAARLLAGRRAHDVLRVERGVEEHRPRPLVDAHLAATSRARRGTVPANAGKYGSIGEARPDGQHHRAQPESASRSPCSGRAPTMATSR